MAIFEKLSDVVLNGDLAGAQELVQNALNEGLEADAILNDGLMKGMEIVGKRFANDDMFIPEVMLSARTLRTGLEILRPSLEKQTSGTGLRKKMVLGTVAGDIHDIGKSLVEMMFIANGYEVFDIGINVPPEGFVEAIQKHKPDVVGLSALLTTTMPAMAQTVQAIDEAGLRNNGLKIIVGGAPVTEEFAKDIKADLYGENALEGVDVANKALE